MIISRLLKVTCITLIFFSAGCAGWSRTEKVLLVASVVMSVADMTTTIEGLNNGGYELNPIIGKHPSDERFISFMVGSEVLTIILAHYFPEWRKAILSGKTLINAGCVIHNLNEGKK